MADIPSFLKTRKAKLTGYILAGIIAVYAIFGFFILPGIIKGKLVDTLREKLHRETTVREIKFNPFLLALTVNGFDLKDLDGSTFVSFEQFHVDFELSSIFYRAFTFAEIRLVSPFGRAEILKDGAYNFSDLLKDDGKTQPEPKPPESGEKQNLPAVIVHLLEIRDGKFLFRDTSEGRDSKAEFGPVEFTVQEFSTRPREGSVYSFSAETTRGEKIDWEGTFLLDPLGSEGKLSIQGVQLRPLWEYIKDRVGFEVRDGRVSVESRYTWDRTRNLRLSGAAIHLIDLKITEKDQEPVLLSVPELHVRDTSLELSAQTVGVPLVESKGTRVVLVREPGGTINLARIFSPPPKTEPAKDGAGKEEPVPAEPSAPAAEKPAADGKPSPPWKVSVEAIRLTDYGVSIEDRTLATPAQINLEPMALEVTGFALPLEKEFGVNLSMKINETGSFETKGHVSLSPLSAEQDIVLDSFPIPAVQPYLDQQLNLVVKTGLANAAGHVSLKAPKGGKSGPPPIEYKGTVSATAFKSVDRREQSEFARWDKLAFNGMDVVTEPLSVQMDEILWEKPYGRVVIRKDQTTNLMDISKSSGKAPGKAADNAGNREPENTETVPDTKTPPPAKAPFKAAIKTVRIVDGGANFSDYSLEPDFTIGIYALNGTIKGLSSSNTGHAKVDLKGKVDRYAPVLIFGEINPLIGNAYTDVTLSFQGIEISTFTPYSAKFAGYLIDKGKLYLDLRYRLNQKKLIGENKVMLDQFTFGEKTDSPDATSLPVKLAVAILKDREGKINIDLPVRGDVDDPDFKYGKLVWSALKNVLEKVATAPFAALANLVVGAGGDQLDHVKFEPGRTGISEEEADKFPSIGKMLAARPVLRIEVKGRAEALKDSAQLKEQKLLQRLREERADEIKSRGDATVKADQIQLSDGDVSRLLRRVYQATFAESAKQVYERLKTESGQPDFPKESSEAGLELVSAALRTRLVATQTVDTAALRELAKARAAAVQSGLIEGGGIEAGRVFIREVEVVEATGPVTGTVPASSGPGDTKVRTELLLTAD